MIIHQVRPGQTKDLLQVSTQHERFGVSVSDETRIMSHTHTLPKGSSKKKRSLN